MESPTGGRTAGICITPTELRHRAEQLSVRDMAVSENGHRYLRLMAEPLSPSRSEGEQGHDGDAVVGLVAVAECGEHDEAGRFSAPGGVYL